MELEPFRCYFWDKPVFQRPNLSDAYNLLEEGKVSQEELDKAFLLLLKSNISIAQGICFDLFFYWETLGRWGMKNPYRRFSSLLLGAARKQLQQASVGSSKSDSANHASALGVISHLGDVSDLAQVASIFPKSKDVNVLEGCLWTIGKFISDLEEVPIELINSFEEFIRDDSIDFGLREDAIGVFRHCEQMPKEIETLCKHVAMNYSPNDSRFPLYAAWTLACTSLSSQRPFLERLVAGWDDNLPFPYSEIKDLLDAEDSET